LEKKQIRSHLSFDINAVEAYTKKAEQQGLDYANFMKEGNTSEAAISQ